jgi:hypothetical protein
MKTTKFQDPSFKEAPNSRFQGLNTNAVLEFGPWNFLGVWILELGAFSTAEERF